MLGDTKQNLGTHKKVYGPQEDQMSQGHSGQDIIHYCIKTTKPYGMTALPQQEGPRRR